MAFNIKNQRVCNLVREAAERFNTTQVEVIEKACRSCSTVRSNAEKNAASGPWRLWMPSMRA